MKELKSQKEGIQNSMREIRDGQNCLKCFGKIAIIPCIIFLVLVIVASVQYANRKPPDTPFIESECLDANTISGSSETS